MIVVYQGSMLVIESLHYLYGFSRANIDIITLIPCILDIALKGRRALRVRMVLNAWIPPAPRREAVKLMRDT